MPDRSGKIAVLYCTELAKLPVRYIPTWKNPCSCVPNWQGTLFNNYGCTQAGMCTNAEFNLRVPSNRKYECLAYTKFSVQLHTHTACTGPYYYSIIEAPGTRCERILLVQPRTRQYPLNAAVDGAAAAGLPLLGATASRAPRAPTWPRTREPTQC